MKKWTWQKWVGKLSPILMGLIAEGVWQFAELPAPGWAPIVAGAITAIVQWLIALFPPKATS